MIVYGWNSFKIKSFSPVELGIVSTEWEGYTFEARQKYFHLFWIPFFGIGKVYVIRKGNDMFEMPQEFIDTIKSRASIRSPFYTFTIPLIALAVITYMSIQSSIAESRFEARMEFQENKEKEKEDQFIAEQNELLAQIDNLSTSSFIQIEGKEEGNDYSLYNAYLKVENVSKDVTCSYFFSSKRFKENNQDELNDLYYDNVDSLKEVRIPLGVLKNAVCMDYYDSESGDIYNEPLLGDNKLFAVINVFNCFKSR